MNRDLCGNKDNPQSASRTAPFKKEPFGFRLPQSLLSERRWQRREPLTEDCRKPQPLRE